MQGEEAGRILLPQGQAVLGRLGGGLSLERQQLDHQPQIVRIGLEQLGHRGVELLAVGAVVVGEEHQGQLGVLGPQARAGGAVEQHILVALDEVAELGRLIGGVLFLPGFGRLIQDLRILDQGLADELLDAGLLLRGEGGGVQGRGQECAQQGQGEQGRFHLFSP
ncbi:hypothetical protein D3C78_1334230 [compost metagenome]